MFCICILVSVHIWLSQTITQSYVNCDSIMLVGFQLWKITDLFSHSTSKEHPRTVVEEQLWLALTSSGIHLEPLGDDGCCFRRGRSRSKVCGDGDPGTSSTPKKAQV